MGSAPRNHLVDCRFHEANRPSCTSSIFHELAFCPLAIDNVLSDLHRRVQAQFALGLLLRAILKPECGVDPIIIRPNEAIAFQQAGRSQSFDIVVNPAIVLELHGERPNAPHRMESSLPWALRLEYTLYDLPVLFLFV